MFEKLAKWYLSYLLRKSNINDLEIVIRSDGCTYYDRNKERESVIKDIVSLASNEFNKTN